MAGTRWWEQDSEGQGQQEGCTRCAPKIVYLLTIRNWQKHKTRWEGYAPPCVVPARHTRGILPPCCVKFDATRRGMPLLVVSFSFRHDEEGHAPSLLYCAWWEVVHPPCCVFIPILTQWGKVGLPHHVIAISMRWGGHIPFCRVAVPIIYMYFQCGEKGNALLVVVNDTLCI